MKLRPFFQKDIYFVTGIDTDAGKTIATGWLSRQLLNEGVNVITQKLVQTGNVGISEDIEKHRALEGRPLQAPDRDHTTHPLLFEKPCSPHMAAALEDRVVDLSLAEEATARLRKDYELILIEGAGGLMVPLRDEFLAIDYIQKHHYPVVLVTTAKLGSINHTLLSLESLKSRGLEVATVVYNEGISTDPAITADTGRFLKGFLSTHFPSTLFLTLPRL